MEVLNNLPESRSIKNVILEKRSNSFSLENVSKVSTKQDKTEDYSDGSYKVANFL